MFSLTIIISGNYDILLKINIFFQNIKKVLDFQMLNLWILAFKLLKIIFFIDFKNVENNKIKPNNIV